MKRFLILSIFLMLVMLNSNSVWAKNTESGPSKKISKQNSATSKRKNTFAAGGKKSEDAKKNWGQIKKGLEENPENYPEFDGMNTKEIKNRITTEKRIRKIARKYEETIGDYYKDSINPLEAFIDGVLNGELNLEDGNNFGISQFNLWRLKREKEKYEDSMEKLTIEEDGSEDPDDAGIDSDTVEQPAELLAS